MHSAPLKRKCQSSDEWDNGLWKQLSNEKYWVPREKDVASSAWVWRVGSPAVCKNLMHWCPCLLTALLFHVCFPGRREKLCGSSVPFRSPMLSSTWWSLPSALQASWSSARMTKFSFLSQVGKQQRLETSLAPSTLEMYSPVFNYKSL